MTETSSAAEVDSFELFFRTAEPRLRQALVSRLGVQAGRDATLDALAYVWERWKRLSSTQNPTGYVYRVGLRSGSRRRTLEDITLSDGAVVVALGRDPVPLPKRAAEIVTRYLERGAGQGRPSCSRADGRAPT